jgi:antirestriction protein ArdC
MDNTQYQRVTDAICAQLESGAKPWSPRWSGSIVRPLRIVGKPYTGVNTLALWSAAMIRGFTSPYWITFKAARELGGQVKEGAKCEYAYFVKSYDRKTGKQDDEGNDETRRGHVFKCYAVFNCDETEGLPAHVYKAPERGTLDPTLRNPIADQYAENVGIPIRHSGDGAFYVPSQDRIQMPVFADFHDASAYYGTLFHEVTHGTGHKSRLDRDLSKGAFGSTDYAFEELVAELGAAYIAADLAIDAEPRADHASYLQSWLKCLRSDPKAIFKAASLAEKAAGYVAKCQPVKLAEAA